MATIVAQLSASTHRASSPAALPERPAKRERRPEQDRPTTPRPRWRLFRTLRSKLLALVVVSITVPIALGAVLVVQSYSASSVAAAKVAGADLASAIAVTFDRFITENERLSYLPVTDQRILTVLQGRSAELGFVSLSERQAVDAAIATLRVESNDVDDLKIYALDGTLFAERDSSGTRWNAESEQGWMSRVTAADGALVILGPQPGSITIGDPDQVTFARLIREPMTHRPLGWVTVHVSTGTIAAVVRANGIRSGEIALVDAEGEQFFPAATADLEPRAEGDVVSVSAMAPSKRFSVQASFLYADLNRDATVLARDWAVIAIAVLLVACVIATIAIRRLLRPIEHLRATMQHVEAGSLSVRAQVETADEVGMLSSSLNSMLDEINALVSSLHDTALREREAEIWKLLGQMHPHFLFNSLEMVNAVALREHQWEISDTVANVGRQFRYLIDVSESLVPLADELAFVESWVAIYAGPPETRTELTIDVPSEHRDRLVPKFLLQPIVENAILHADPDRERRVTIRSRDGDDGFVVEVTNSAAVDPDAITALRERLSSPSAPEPERDPNKRGAGGHALRNIKERLHLHFGADAELRFRTTDSTFTVEIEMPGSVRA